MFVRFEQVRKPNSYNDSPITSLSWMRNDWPGCGQGTATSAVVEASGDNESGNNPEEVAPQSPTSMHHAHHHHHHHWARTNSEVEGLDLNNNNSVSNNANNNATNNANSNEEGNSGSSTSGRQQQHSHPHHHVPPTHRSKNCKGPQSDDAVSVAEDDVTMETTAKDGWLAVGNSRGIVGVSYTTTKPFLYNKLMGLSPTDPTYPRSIETALASRSATPRHHPNVSDMTFSAKPEIEQQRTANANCLRGHIPSRMFTSSANSNSNNTSDTNSSLPSRTNYNLRGHRAEILFVRWNEPYQKLATCDENGVIFIWIKYEGRWSIELINDRNTRVNDIAWSHDGRMALIVYMDGFVLVGSVSGQRYWSSMLNLNDFNITCGVWNPSDTQVLFGTSSGQILVLTVHGNFVTQTTIQECVEISSMSWNCGKFLTNTRNQLDSSEHRLAVAFVDGSVIVLKNYDDLDGKIISTDLLNIKLDWSEDGETLVVGGHRLSRSQAAPCGGPNGPWIYTNVIKFYSRRLLEAGDPSATDCPQSLPLITSASKTVELPFTQQPLSALVWGNNDRRLYVACGQIIFVGWVFPNIPSLSFLSRIKIFTCLKDESKVDSIPVPEPIKCSIAELYAQSICCYLPDYGRIREFVFRPPPAHHRLYCTLMRHDAEQQHQGRQQQQQPPSGPSQSGTSARRPVHHHHAQHHHSSSHHSSSHHPSSHHPHHHPHSQSDDMNATYVLYLEYMGGLVPILKGKRSSKLKTEFVIFDPDMPPQRSEPQSQQQQPQQCIKPANLRDSGNGKDVRFRSSSSGPSVNRGGASSSAGTSRRAGANGAQYSSSGANSNNDNSSDSESDNDSFIFPYLTPKTRRRLRCGSANYRRYLLGRSGGAGSGTRSNNNNNRDGDADSMEEGLIRRRFSTPPPANGPLVGGNTVANERSALPIAPVMDDLPERNKIILVASNIWGTKFKFRGLTPMLPFRLGSMTYRTSFLHLQPRQMALVIKELNTLNTDTTLNNGNGNNGLICPQNVGESKSTNNKQQQYGSNNFLVSSDSEDDYSSSSEYAKGPLHPADATSCTNTPAIAPMTPFKSVRNSMLFSTVNIPDGAEGGVVVAARPSAQGTSAQGSQGQSASAFVENATASIHAAPIELANGEPLGLNLESRINQECSSIASRLANMTEEFLTLQINQNDTGRPTYSMELTTGSHRTAQVQKEPEYYHSPDESPLDPCAPAATETSSSSGPATMPIMVRQFKHQSFQSESPKHVSYFTRHQPPSSLVKSSMAANHGGLVSAGSPNISPNIRQKILKESPRKSSVSYCSSEFSAPSQGYAERDDALVVNGSSDTKSKGAVMKFKSCSSEAYAAAAAANTIVGPPNGVTPANFVTNSPPTLGSFSADSTISRGANNPSQGPGSFFTFTPNQASSILNGELFNGRGEETQCSAATTRSASGNLSSKPLANLGGSRIATYEIYDDTNLFAGSGVGTPTTSSTQPFSIPIDPNGSTIARRRMQFRNSSMQSKSFESPLKTPGDPLKDSFDLSESEASRHLSNLEAVVKILSDKLTAAAREKEEQLKLMKQQQQSQHQLDHCPNSQLPEESSKQHRSSRTNHLSDRNRDLLNRSNSLHFAYLNNGDNNELKTMISLRGGPAAAATSAKTKDWSNPASFAATPKDICDITSIASMGTLVTIGDSGTEVGRCGSKTTSSASSSSSSILSRAGSLIGLWRNRSAPNSPLKNECEVSKGSSSSKKSKPTLSTALSTREVSSVGVDSIAISSTDGSSSRPSSAGQQSQGGSASAVVKRRSIGRAFLNSPSMIRKIRRKWSYLDCSSEDDGSGSDDDDDLSIAGNASNGGSLNSSACQTPNHNGNSKHRQQQQAQSSGASSSGMSSAKSLRRRFKLSTSSSSKDNEPRSKGEAAGEGSCKHFVLHNKAPLWNEITQVYQLDFGGRVTQESAKNFQIEYDGRQVMQFGRIDKNAYTLDFEYPFSAVQALSVALANVTQRFK